MRSVPYCLVLAAAIFGSSCGSADDSRPPTCEAVGAHLSAVCMSNFFGEGVRLDCQVFGLDSATRRCLVGITQCGTASVTACGVTNIVVVCTANEDCPTPLVCDTAAQECAECTADVSCPSGKTCFGGVCAASL